MQKFCQHLPFTLALQIFQLKNVLLNFIQKLNKTVFGQIRQLDFPDYFQFLQKVVPANQQQRAFRLRFNKLTQSDRRMLSFFQNFQILSI